MPASLIHFVEALLTEGFKEALIWPSRLVGALRHQMRLAFNRSAAMLAALAAAITGLVSLERSFPGLRKMKWVKP